MDFLSGFTNIILLFNRGYPSGDMFDYLNTKNILFRVCVSKIFKKAISERDDTLFSYYAFCNKEGLTLRSIHFLLEDGSSEYLVTNLTQSQMSTEIFSDLYLLRWGVESKYRELKNRLEIENFNNVMTVNIRQEFFVAMYLSNLAAFIKSSENLVIL